jgi:hypothetical protein
LSEERAPERRQLGREASLEPSASLPGKRRRESVCASLVGRPASEVIAIASLATRGAKEENASASVFALQGERWVDLAVRSR